MREKKNMNIWCHDVHPAWAGCWCNEPVRLMRRSFYILKYPSPTTADAQRSAHVRQSSVGHAQETESINLWNFDDLHASFRFTFSDNSGRFCVWMCEGQIIEVCESV